MNCFNEGGLFTEQACFLTEESAECANDLTEIIALRVRGGFINLLKKLKFAQIDFNRQTIRWDTVLVARNKGY